MPKRLQSTILGSGDSSVASAYIKIYWLTDALCLIRMTHAGFIMMLKLVCSDSK